MPLNNGQIAALFDEMADILEFQAANPFRVRAYRNAARTLGDLGESVAAIVADPARRLRDLPGIGEDIAAKITALVQSGTLAQLEELRAAVPASVLEMLRIPGLGPKKAAVLHRELSITTLDQLREACQAERVRALKGFGAKTEQAILAGLPLAASANERIYWAEADRLVQALLTHLKTAPGLVQLEAAGSYRRGRETIGDLDFLAVASSPGPVMDRLASFEQIDSVLARGDTKMSIRLTTGLQVDLRVVSEESFGAALLYFTGSKDHNVVLRGRAKDRGLKVNEYGVYRDDVAVAGRSEEECYAALGIPWIPPELREARREFDWADRGALPKLVELGEIVGDLHMHTTATDGNATLAEMAAAARQRGLSYIAITDHSQRVSMANGLTADRLRKQFEEIDRLNAAKPGITVLKGIEVDILERGGLDLPDDVLLDADWVVASLHYGQKQPREQITARILEALDHPAVSAIAHPTGRIINRRASYDVDLDAVFDRCRQRGKLLELNANPARLDLDDVACAAAKAHEIHIVISTDAHSTEGLGVMRYGILQARRAGLTAADVANTRPWPEMAELVARGPRAR